MKGSHHQAELKALYMAEEGCALRTAQLHALKGHPKWLAFIARTAGAAVKSHPAVAPSKPQLAALSEHLQLAEEKKPPSTEAPQPAAALKPVHLRTVEEHAEVECWRAFCEASDQRLAMLKNGDPMAAVGFVKIAADAQKAFHLAHQRRVQSDIERGRLKPVSAWQAVCASLSKIAGIVNTVEEVAGAANPASPQIARKALTDWKNNRFMALVKIAIADVQATIDAAA